MDFLTRVEILEKDDLQYEVVEVPEWGGKVRVVGISAKARDRWEVSIADQREKGKPMDVRASLVAKSCVDADGKKVFTDADVQKLGAKSASAVERVFTVCMKLSGLATTDVEELEKN